ncbi:MAG: hypothetical protein HY657_07550 [Acidobacteria bacterium]|nr:hypothetical protein [Acidobacteriota bacterium]
MAAGRRPFEGETAFEVASAILNRAPRAVPDSMPAELRVVIDRCLAKDPAQRYQHAGALRAALESALAGATPAPQPEPAGRRWRSGLAAAGALTLAGAVLWSTVDWGAVSNRSPEGASGPPRIASIAVLPLENLSGDPDEEYFAAGIQVGLITELARLRSLDRVIERRSTQRFSQTSLPVPEVAATLGVDAVVTGSVLRTGDRVQVTAQVIDAATERHLWADRYERDVRDVLSIQNDVAAAVARAIGIELTPELQQRWARRGTIDPQTYEAYLRGMYLVSRGGGTREDRQRGIAIPQEAIDRNPADAHAYAGLALGYITLGHGPAATAEAWPNARAAALRAVTLDPELAEAHSALAEVRMYYEWDWAGAEQAFRRANELNPNLAMNHYHYAWYHALFGRIDEAIAEHKRAQELDPLTPVHTAYLGLLYLYQGRPDDALAEARKAAEFAPAAPLPWGMIGAALSVKGLHEEAIAAAAKAASIDPLGSGAHLGMVHAAAGRIDEARAILATLEAQPPVPFSVWSLSQLHIALGDHDAAFRWLAHRPAHAFLPWIRVHPPFAPLWKDPRFAALMAEMRLPAP